MSTAGAAEMFCEAKVACSLWCWVGNNVAAEGVDTPEEETCDGYGW